MLLSTGAMLNSDDVVKAWEGTAGTKESRPRLDGDHKQK